MSELFILPEPRPGGTDRPAWRAWTAHGESVAGTLVELAAWRDRHAPESAITLLLPAEWLLLTEVTLPTRQAGKRAQALPFALEEHLLQDPARLHCVAGAPDGDGRSAAAAVDRERLQGVLDALGGANLLPSRALPDALCLPLETGRLTALDADGRCLLRWGAAHGTAVPS
ncbi:MAG: type II secretion system protein GspL, partial [Xanthomonadales bacterium]|nr:type II secretion system protein GspL [Xanthomonadales bacterium]